MKKLIVKLEGGLGNQMFCYSAGFALAKHLKRQLIIDESSYLGNIDHCNRRYELNNYLISADSSKNLKYKGYLNGKFKEYFYRYKYKVLNEITDLDIKSDKDIYLKGFNQRHKLFDEYKNELSKEFRLKDPSSKLLELIEKYKNEETVSLHMRYGDYVKIGCTLNEEYYVKALNYISSQYNGIKLKVLVFTEDIIKSKFLLDKLKDKFNFIYVDESFELSDLEQFELMKNCKNHIISNSTYSYFAAYLAENEGITIAPHVCGWLDNYWKDDYFSDEWFKIKTDIKNEKEV